MFSISTNRMSALLKSIALIVIGTVILFPSPQLFLFSQSGRIVTTQPWLIGVKGMIGIQEVERHLCGVPRDTVQGCITRRAGRSSRRRHKIRYGEAQAHNTKLRNEKTMVRDPFTRSSTRIHRRCTISVQSDRRLCVCSQDEREGLGGLLCCVRRSAISMSCTRIYAYAVNTAKHRQTPPAARPSA
ncbi:uncharacterized protein EDB91DRAFT_1156454 [Suillus paluster]|uniref:uncharacterized protein n=1 Tax=Suillus paluster TaxID=48578 RepID=UPI001B885252|nr:uncharacterized protein EDB91DRAFT_1156454 [Suillus paluster]KAG1730670.1 hypothetical protein EDB91DRAFT_1156454 [Suillus paluster]